MGCSQNEATNTVNLEPVRQSAMNNLQALLKSWYPTVIDSVYGGYLSNLDRDFVPMDEQEKMIVSQARHLWTTSQEYLRSGDRLYLDYASHGFDFLDEKMWDQEYGGFYQFVDQGGVPMDRESMKTAYGNAFALYGLSAYFRASEKPEALELAQQTFDWLEQNSHDSIYGGYFQHLARSGDPIIRPDSMASTSDLGYKDYNSSIHLLEAFAEYYRVNPDSLVKSRLKEMFHMVRDTLMSDKYYLNFFFTPDWKHVNFRDSSRSVIDQHYYLDHVSFTHDIETAYLLQEASELFEYEVESTLQFTRQMVEHSLKGWDKERGGIYDAGYYFGDNEELEIVRKTKSWWGQAEAFHTFVLFHKYFPDAGYDRYASRQWDYLNKYMIDPENSGWYTNGLDTDPESVNSRKGQVWKTTYHNYRALSRSIFLLQE